MLNIQSLGLVPINTKTILGISLAAVFAISLLGSAYATGYLTIESASVTATPTEITKAKIYTGEKIPKKGEALFGYGIVTSGTDLVVATTHAGVLDSQKQKGDPMSPKWHNHYVKLAEDVGCEDPVTNPLGLRVVDISYESPGKVNVKGDKIELKDVPLGTDIPTHIGIAPNAVSAATTGTYGGAVTSFELRGIADPTYGIGVCVCVCVCVCVDNLSPFVP